MRTEDERQKDELERQMRQYASDRRQKAVMIAGGLICVLVYFVPHQGSIGLIVLIFFLLLQHVD